GRRGRGGAAAAVRSGGPWGVGRGEQILPREPRREALRVLTVPKDLTKGCLWGGSAPPNGSRLSCGRPARRRKAIGRQSAPARAQHSASLRAITARQLQALVRRLAPHRQVLPHAFPATAPNPAAENCERVQGPGDPGIK